jgi:hypothetical protein
MVGYAYGMEFFIAWYSGVDYEQFAFINRAFGPYWWAYWIMVSCNVISPSSSGSAAASQPDGAVRHLDLRQHRHVVRALRDHGHVAAPRLPAVELGYFSPTLIDILTYAGSFGLFFTMFLLFCRFLPILAISE